jgi:hypothetical protein
LVQVLLSARLVIGRIGFGVSYSSSVSELEPQKHPKTEIAPRHIPQVVVPVPLDEVRDFMRSALRGTSLVDPLASALSGWLFFEPHLRFTSVDATHTRIEIDVVGTSRRAETLLYSRRRGEIDRFFVAIQDELDRRSRWTPHQPTGGAAIDDAPIDSAAIDSAD